MKLYPSHLIQVYACDKCTKIYENLETEDIYIMDSRKWGKKCPDCGDVAILVSEVMT